MVEQQTIDELVEIEGPDVTLEGNLVRPQDAGGIVLFAHGSGSSRHSPRNRFVAQELQNGGLATLLFDLLTSEEERVDRVTRHLRFDIDLLAERLVGAIDWVQTQPELQDLAIGGFGSSTGAAAALIAARDRPGPVQAVVSRGGRPDLAEEALPEVSAPTLLIVGEQDVPVIDMNQQALEQLGAEVKQLELVPNATHLFEEPGALETVARLARDWFQRYLSKT